jgi:butyryl-CoA dehydrogenase/short/branched chain acyl-CoA dehydrogenase
MVQPHAAAPTALTQLSADECMLRDTVRKFAASEIAPLVRSMDESQQMDPGLLGQLFSLGLMGIEIPEPYGGSSGTFFEAILAVEEISAVDPAVGVLVDVQNTLCINALVRWATEDQKQRYLTRLATDTIGAYALSEAASGSDAFALETRATPQGDGYVLNGQKLWITNAKEAGLFIVFATIDRAAGYKGITAFLVEKDTPGFTLGKKEDKLGIRASSTCELIFQDCRVPASNVLGEPGKGYKIAIETLNEGRIGIGAQMLGLAQGAWQHAVRWAK